MTNVVMVDLLGTEVSVLERKILNHPNVGSVLLMERNFSNPLQLKNLLSEIRNIRPELFVAVDHEGGCVQRFQRQGFRSWPAARVYGDVYDLNPSTGIQLAQNYGKKMAAELCEYGIDLSLAPVLDLHSDNQVIGTLDRAFHADPGVVTALTLAFIQGMHSAGMPAVGKHFPGHGPVHADSHLTMPVCYSTREQLNAGDLRPFIDLISENHLDAVMPAHVTYSEIDAKYPTGFSASWLKGILRDDLKFKGMVISDCLGMAGAEIGDMQTRIRLSLDAGCDMLIIGNQTRETLYKILQSAKIEQSLESANRIKTFKKRMTRFAADCRQPRNTQINTAGLSVQT